jgi:hypothetical protein
MAATITITRQDATQSGIILEGTIALSGNYATGGQTIDFSAVPQIPSNLGPQGLVQIAEQPASGATPAGYLMWLIAGSTAANWKLWIATADGQPPTELAAGAYPAALAAATIQFRAFFLFGV